MGISQRLHCLFALLLGLTLPLAAQAQSSAAAPVSAPPADCADDAGIHLPPGFCASIFADNIGHARHLAVSADNVVYANTWSGVYFGNDMPHPGGFLVAMKDTQGTGHADQVVRFGETPDGGGHGGTGIALYNGYVYAESADRIVRYALNGEVVPKDGTPMQTVLSGMPLTGDHPMHPFIIDPDGKLYVDMASESNSCQQDNRQNESPGMGPCPQLQVRAGVWRYDANTLNQQHTAGARFATGIRNADGLSFDQTGRNLWATQHGRDQLGTNWSKLYTLEQGATLPAEELLRVTHTTDAGWPTCYYDQTQRKLVLAPEYGGNGGHRVGVCASKQAPVAAFPAHWAPNDLLLYYGTAFPQRFRGGAFIAFHGSWNRAPFAQQGFNVVFQPLSGGKASARCEIFADGFAEALVTNASQEHYRPTGLALGPDGALYVADDVKGRIYRIVYRGGAADAQATLRPCPSDDASAGPQLTTDLGPPAGTQKVAVPPGATAAMVADGDQLFHGATCAGCHGSDGAGTSLGPTLKSSQYLWSDGSEASIRGIIAAGVAQPKNFRSAMPAMGGSSFMPEQLNAVAAYVWSLSHSASAQ